MKTKEDWIEDAGRAETTGCFGPNEQGLRITIPDVSASNPNDGTSTSPQYYFDGTNLKIY